MAKRRKTDLELEKMTDANIAKVIKLLESQDGKPITKKDACQILGMSYNTTRLASIIEEFKQKQLRIAEQKAKLRGKPVTNSERINIIQEYLSGATVESISKMTYRGSHLIKQVLEDNSVPIRQTGHNYFTPQLIPDGAIRDRFQLDEIVYSARYDSMAKIRSEKLDPKHGYIYSLWLLSERWLQWCWQPAYELASLEHLRKIGVQV
ncbi:MAG: hypothetical protein EBR82_82385 [Caulobacteraceae bacterium]|nr:hypothetical protein [Caulobacteraceae bacterium]